LLAGGQGTNRRLNTYTGGTATTGTTTSTAATATAATTAGSAAAGALRTRTLAVGTLNSLLASRLGLASELNGDLALEDLLAGELLDGTLSLGRSGEVDESVADRAVGARVLWDRNGLTGWGGGQQREHVEEAS
jgi:hypothetical protein